MPDAPIDPAWKRGAKSTAAVILFGFACLGAFQTYKSISGPTTVGGMVGCRVEGISPVDVEAIMKLRTGVSFYADFSSDLTGIGAAATRKVGKGEQFQDVSTANDAEASECGAGSAEPTLFLSVHTVDSSGRDTPAWHHIGGGAWTLTGLWQLRSSPAMEQGHVSIVLQPGAAKAS